MYYGWSTLKKLIYLRAFKASGGGGTSETITGVSPLLLLNALAKPLTSLTQYGKVSQASTPSGSNVPIVCNNGTLAFIDDDLPSGYTRLQSIHFDGASYFDSGIVPNTYDYEIETKVAFDNATSTPLCAWGYMGNQSSLPRWLLASYSSGYLLNANTTAAMGVAFDTDPHIFKGVVLEADGTPKWRSYIDGEQKQSINLTSTASWEANTLSIYIGTRNNSGTAGSNNYFTGDLYYHKVYKGGVLIQHLIPCMDGNGTLGFYDLVTNTFFTNAGSGTLTAGAVDYSHAHIGAVGTPEVISISVIAPILADNIEDGYGLNSSSGARASNPARCYTCLGYYPAGTAIAVRAKMTNMGGYVYVYATDDVPSTQTFIASASMTAAEDIGGGWYERTGTTTASGYVYVQCTTNKTTALAAEWSATQPIQTASAVNLFAVGDYADTQDIISGAVNRKVGMLVLDGTETWSTSSGIFYIRVSAAVTGYGRQAVISTHYVGTDETNANMPDKSMKTANNSGSTYLQLYCKDTSCANATEFKAYLAAQYAAGTPVIVLYPLATPTTEQTDPQTLSTAKGDNVVSWTAAVEGKTMEAVYTKAPEYDNLVGSALVGTAKAG